MSKEVEEAKATLKEYLRWWEEDGTDKYYDAIQTILKENDKYKELKQEVEKYKRLASQNLETMLEQKDKIIDLMADELVEYETNPMFGKNAVEVKQYFEDKAKGE